MSEKLSPSLEGVSETLLMTLNVRARESQRPGGMIHDERAVDIVSRLNVDFSRLRMQRHDDLAVIARMNQFDNSAREFLSRNPGAAVVHIGCGLDTRFERVDNGSVTWFDLDMPDVIALRRELIPCDVERHHDLAASAFEESWLDEVRRLAPGAAYLFMAEGVLAYFPQEQVKTLVLRLRDNFPGCELVCDELTPFAVWANNLHLALGKVEARLHWSMKNGKMMESWGAGIRLLDEWTYYEDEKSVIHPYRWMRFLPFLAKAAGVYHYRLGNAP